MKLKVKIPTDLSDIKLSQYQKFIRTTKDSEDDAYIARQMVAIFCNLSDKLVDSIKAKDYNGIIEDINKVLTQEPKFKTTFRHEGIKYGFIPDIEDITVGEKADLDTFLQDVQKMHLAMGVMYRPIKSQVKNKYLIEDYSDKNKGLDVTLDIALAANGFFLNLMHDLLNYTQSYIEVEVAHNPKLSQTLEENGVGTTAFINSQKGIFSDLKRLVDLGFTMR